MIRQLLELAKSLIKQDRIRVSPSEGRLLRLSPSCVLTIGSETVRIVSRTVRDTPDGPSVSYECETDSGYGQLVIQLTRTFRTDATWRANGVDTPIAEADLLVWPLPNESRRSSN